MQSVRYENNTWGSHPERMLATRRIAMPYLLKFHFDPDYERRRLRPKNRDDGSVDQYDLGYAQNVVAGQVLAEWEELPPEAPQEHDGRLSDDIAFAHGEGCRVDPSSPLRLLASVNGHVSCVDGAITVRETLSVGRDVDFHTGNIVAIGDVLIGGNVRSGFLVMGRNATIRGAVEAARVQAMGNITCQAGIQGGSRATLRAGKSLRAKFAENAVLHAGQNILIDGSSMHCRLFAGEKLAVKGRLVGGEAYCGEAVYVGEQLGGGDQSQTRILLGYDAERIHKDQHLKALVRETLVEIEACQAEAGKGSERAEACDLELDQLHKRLAAYKAQLLRLWASPAAMRRFSTCRVIVPGHVGANVEIGIGEAVLAVPEGTRDAVFRYHDGEIVTEHPALHK
ncbi:protein of unknown function DUF342 [Solidesulfovibrio carbinoliphilus subsp. oakridgensis]|uniref:DUF342 domain-containing protein n=1 Tax=Solidesulfovibrio carbinoliphilus subsp. oakridgensis TaxID=694327 RepID=G7QB03_9BACT|nr:FapA family protein [Solidesulfovibrio carbinoliphilus]EHJ48344.1 protein of unknown function DUF342 [Solidesulfovibrio carbinoliphilus subsp. oakridgensis]